MSDALVRIIIGKLGAGKTWYTVRKLLDALMCGQVVVTNIVLNWDAVVLACGKVKVPRENYRFITTKAITQDPEALFALMVPGCCLALDEVHLIMNAREWRDNMAKGKDFLTFLTQGRKYRVDVWLITQDERNADAQLVRMATNIVRLVNWQHVPLLGLIAPFPLTIALVCKPDGVTVIGKEYVMRRGVVGTCYDTHQKFDDDLQLGGVSAAPVIGVRKRQMSYGVVLMGVGATMFLVDLVLRHKSEKREAEKAASLAAIRAEHAQKQAAQIQIERQKPMPAFVSASEKVQSERSPLCTATEIARIESQLPPVYRCNSAVVTLVGGQRLGHGTYFLAGPVVGWKNEGASVLVRIDSPAIKQVRLFYGNNPRPLLYDYAGGILRSSSGGARRDGGGVLPVVRSGDVGNGGGVSSMKPQLYVPGQGENPAQLFVPNAIPAPSVLEQLQSGSETRNDTPPPADGGPRT